MSNKTYLFLLFFFVIVPCYVIAQKNTSVKSLKYCDVFDSTLEGKRIRTKAFVKLSTVGAVDGNDTFLYSPLCNNGDYFAIPEISNQSNQSIWNLTTNNLTSNKEFLFEIEFIGKLRTLLVPEFGHLSWCRAEMKILKIINLQDMTTLIPRPNFGNTPLIDKGKQLQAINNEAVKYIFFGADNSQDIKLAENFTISDVFGNTANAERMNKVTEKYFGRFNNSNPIRASISMKQAKKVGKFYIVSGLFKYIVKTVSTKIAYKNTYTFSSNSWTLNSTKLSKL
jgi:hypothetical protein